MCINYTIMMMLKVGGDSKPVIKVLDEHVALASSFRSVAPPIILVEEKMKCVL